MTKEEVDRMIDRQGVYEIKYGRYIIHIGVIKWSEIHSDCIWCYCNEWGIYITLNYKKIESCKQYWVETWDNKELAQRTGLHLFACKGDNHLITEIYWLNEGEPLWKYFEKEFGHSNGWELFLLHIIVLTSIGPMNRAWLCGKALLVKRVSGTRKPPFWKFQETQHSCKTSP